MVFRPEAGSCVWQVNTGTLPAVLVPYVTATYSVNMNRFIVFNRTDVLFSDSLIYSGMSQRVRFKETFYYFVRLYLDNAIFLKKYSECKIDEWKNLNWKSARARDCLAGIRVIMTYQPILYLSAFLSHGFPSNYHFTSYLFLYLS